MYGSKALRGAATVVAASALALAACASGGGDAETEAVTSVPTSAASPSAAVADAVAPNPVDELVEVAAPIVSIDVVSLDSAPPQYVAHVVSTQPDGCHRFARFAVETDGATINVAVLNTRPADLTVVLCAQQYSETTSEVPLGTLQSGTDYTLNVNGETQTFVAE